MLLRQAAPPASRALAFIPLLLLAWQQLHVLAVDVHFRGQLYIQSSTPELPPYWVPPLPSDPAKPRNIHLAFGPTEAQLVVTWSTLTNSDPALVRFRPIGCPKQPWITVNGTSAKFVDGGSLRAVQFIHRVPVSGLPPGKSFEFFVGNGTAWSSEQLDFRVPGGNASAARSFAIYGDLGLKNAQSLPRLFDDAVTRRVYDAIVHVGDFAYDMPDENGLVGDRFMQMMQPIAGRVPYMTCVGNHEEKYNFSHYRARFSMPDWQSTESLFYSVNIGPVHLVSIANEFYFFLNYGTAQIDRQYHWLEADLQAANRNRSQAPWIVLIGHRPMYCSNVQLWDCQWGARTLRDGFHGNWALEPLMLRYGVDLAFWGHEHSYERTWPVARNRVVPSNGSSRAVYLNPGAPVHVITGSAGNKEKHATFTGSQPPFSAFRSNDYGYTRVLFLNASHAYLEQVSDDRGGEVIDKFALVQTQHGPFKEA